MGIDLHDAMFWFTGKGADMDFFGVGVDPFNIAVMATLGQNLDDDIAGGK